MRYKTRFFAVGLLFTMLVFCGGGATIAGWHSKTTVGAGVVMSGGGWGFSLKLPENDIREYYIGSDNILYSLHKEGYFSLIPVDRDKKITRLFREGNEYHATGINGEDYIFRYNRLDLVEKKKEPETSENPVEKNCQGNSGICLDKSGSLYYDGVRVSIKDKNKEVKIQDYGFFSYDYHPCYINKEFETITYYYFYAYDDTGGLWESRDGKSFYKEYQLTSPIKNIATVYNGYWGDCGRWTNMRLQGKHYYQFKDEAGYVYRNGAVLNQVPLPINNIDVYDLNGYGIDPDGNLWVVHKGKFIQVESPDTMKVKSFNCKGNFDCVFTNRDGSKAVVSKGKLIKLPKGVAEKDLLQVRDSYFAIDSEGKLWVAGDNPNGVLAVGDTKYRENFVRVKNPSGSKFVSMYWHISSDSPLSIQFFVLTDTGELYASGSGSSGFLGVGDRDDRHQLTRVKIPSDVKVKDFNIDKAVFTIRDTKDQLYLWGNGYSGRIPGGCNTYVEAPRPLLHPQGGQFDISRHYNSGDHADYIFDTNGDLYVWGINTWGRLGANVPSGVCLNQPMLVKHPKAGKFKYIVPGNYVNTDKIAEFYALDSAGKLFVLRNPPLEIPVSK